MAQEEKRPPCKACNAELQPGAKFCKECRSWQRARISDVLPLLVAISSLATAAVTALFFFLDRPSKTSLMVTDLDANAISCYVWNTGRRPSLVVRSVLTFGPFAYKDAVLEVADPKMASIPGAGGVSLELQLARLKKRCTEPLTPEMALVVDIMESGGSLSKKRWPFSRDQIKRLLRNKRGEVDPCK